MEGRCRAVHGRALKCLLFTEDLQIFSIYGSLVYVFYLRQVPQTSSVFRASKDLEGTEEL